MKNICMAASLAVAMVVGISINANASIITWETAVQIDDAGAFVDRTGSLLVAINSDDAGDNALINGINFAGTDLTGWNTGVTGAGGVTISSNALNGNFDSTFVQGGGPPAPITDPAINNLIGSGIWGTQTVTLTGLTPGNTYIVQIIGNDSRNGRHENFVTLLSDGENDVFGSLTNGTAGLNSLSNSAPTDADPRLPGSAIIGTFTADATTQTFELAGTANGGASFDDDRAQINGFQLRTTSVLPELAQLVHPGISHKRSDLDRMKLMVEAGIEPWASTYAALRSHSRAKHTYVVGVVNQDPSFVTEYSDASDAWFINDGTAAYYNALMWYITGDERHAEKSIEIFNTYKGLRRNSTGIPLRSGRIWRIIEAAEIIAHTYDGWDPVDMQEFKDMLVYPGYSATTVPTQAIQNDDYTFYWHIYNGDPARHGNQGLFAMRTMMAMGIFLDNEVMYERALRYLRGESHRPDDLSYPSGPPINNNEITSCGFFDEFTNNGFQNTIQDYGYNEVISNYIYENGQSQESSRDQAHGLAGVGTIQVISEMAWSQGDDLYGHLNNRPLLGMEFYLRYNMSVEFPFMDQPQPWEPTVESGEYIVRSDRSGRWTSRIINPGVNCDQNNLTRGNETFRPIYEMSLAHYRDRMSLPSDDYKWLQRGHLLFVDEVGVEKEGVVTDHPVWGSLAFRRVSPGDPISGFDSDGLPEFAMHMLPGTIEAENFDYFPAEADGQGRSYSDTTSGNQGGAYRFDSDVDVQENAEGDIYIGLTGDGEFLTYTVHVPETGNYTIGARVGAPLDGTNIRLLIDGVDQTGEVPVPNTGMGTDWTNIALASNLPLTQGVHQVRIDILGAFMLDSFTIAEPMVGDFNGDGLVDCGDLDAYVGNMGAAATGALAGLDLGGNGTVDVVDTNLFIEFLLETSNGVVGTFPGDLNCDGRVDVLGDAFALVSNLGNSTSSYADGDVNFDGTVSVLGDAFILIGNLGKSNQ